jgi:hypothetical protein
MTKTSPIRSGKNAASNARNEAIRAVTELHDALRKSYWYTPDEQAGDRIVALADAVYDILTTLNRSTLDAHTSEYKRAKARMDEVSAALAEARAEIRSIVRSVEIAGKVIQGIDTALAAAAKFFL